MHCTVHAASGYAYCLALLSRLHRLDARRTMEAGKDGKSKQRKTPFTNQELFCMNNPSTQGGLLWLAPVCSSWVWVNRRAVVTHACSVWGTVHVSFQDHGLAQSETALSDPHPADRGRTHLEIPARLLLPKRNSVYLYSVQLRLPCALVHAVLDASHSRVCLICRCVCPSPIVPIGDRGV